MSGDSALLPAQAAAYLGVGRSFLYERLIRSGAVTPVRLSTKVVRFSRQALDDYVATLTATPPVRKAS